MISGSIDLTHTPNILLAGLSAADKEAIRPFLRRFRLDVRTTIEGRNMPVETAHFMESGMVSIVASTTHHRQVEVGVIGREGMTGLPLLLGSVQSPNAGVVQIAGTSLGIDRQRLADLMEARPGLHHRVDLFVQSFIIQISQTTLANSKAKIDQRLARWLLMVRDRAEDDRIPLTHESISIMLGVRRAAVTVALHNLESEQLIRASRGLVTIRDYERLRAFANGLYGVAEVEYERLLGTPIARHIEAIAAE
jgi:CRP-like cAMP-binding protein